MISRRGPILLGAALVAFSATDGWAQSSFKSYECADGSQFVLAFYRYDPNAHVQIDGKSVELKKSLAVSGQRFSTRGITLWIEKAGAVSIKHGKRPVSVCREVRS